MRLKQYIPSRLFYRFLLIIVMPVIFVQLISTYIFYQTHLQKVIKKISAGTIEKIVYIANNFKLKEDYNEMNIDVKFYKGQKINKKDIIKDTDKYVFFNQEQFFIENLLANIKNPIAVKKNEDNFIILVQKNNGTLSMIVNKKELIVKTAKIFVTWNLILSFITILIAVLFMKNQVKPIKLLKKHVKNFSINQKLSKFKPTGAKEIRDLTLSFLEMEKRIAKFVNQRTLMLAGISHDLRTPLTRMKLELEMMDSPSKSYLEDDIHYMESIINQYLNFTKTLTVEDKTLVNVYDYINGFVKEYRKTNKNITFRIRDITKEEMISVQILSFKRVLQNILDNAFKFGTKVIITLKNIENKRITLDIEDNGGGVSEENLEKLSEPFFKIDTSRNIDQKGVGLGLAIAKDIVLSQNGIINFSNSKKTHGLDVQITLNLFH